MAWWGPAPRVDPRSGVALPNAEESARLLARVGAGETEALGLFYDLWAAPVEAFVSRFVAAPDDIEWVIEQIFWCVWSAAREFHGTRGPVIGWLLAICQQCTRDAVVRLRAGPRTREWRPKGGSTRMSRAGGVFAVPRVPRPES